LEELKNVTADSAAEFQKYFSMLPDTSGLKNEFKNLTKDSFNFEEIRTWAKDRLTLGSIDVNIMTKVGVIERRRSGRLSLCFAADETN